MGVVHLDINRARIDLRTKRRKDTVIHGKSTYRFAEKSRNILVFGIRSNNVAIPDGNIPKAWMTPWQRFSSRFASNIRAYSYQNAIVSNNRLNDRFKNALHPISDDSYDQPGYVALSGTDTVSVSDGSKTRFSYTDHYGISLNRKSAIRGATPAEEPDLFRKGIEVCDNWVYKTMRVGIYAAGYGLKVNRNVLKDTGSKQVFLHPAGHKLQDNNAATYENRGIDFSGWFVEVNDNRVEVYRHLIRNSGYYSVDGEGILIQECCGGTTVNGIAIKRNQLNDYIGVYKMKDIYNVHIAENDLGGSNIFVEADKSNGDQFSIYSTIVEDNYNVGSGIKLRGTIRPQSADTSWIRNNSGSSTIEYPCYVQLNNNTGFSIDPCDTAQDQNLQRSYAIAIVEPTKDSLITTSTFPVQVVLGFQSSTTSIFDRFHLLNGIDTLSSKAADVFQGPGPMYSFRDTLTISQPGDYNYNALLEGSGGVITYSNRVHIHVLNPQDFVNSAAELEKDTPPFTVYPNPTRQYLIVQNHNSIQPQPAEYRLFNFLGKEVYTQQSAESVVQLQLPSLPAGVYLLRRTTTQSVSTFQRVIIK